MIVGTSFKVRFRLATAEYDIFYKLSEHLSMALSSMKFGKYGPLQEFLATAPKGVVSETTKIMKNEWFWNFGIENSWYYDRENGIAKFSLYFDIQGKESYKKAIQDWFLACGAVSVDVEDELDDDEQDEGDDW